MFVVNLKTIKNMARNNEKIEITKTELRALMFWAHAGIERMRGGSYEFARDYIRNNYNVMPKHHHREYRSLEFGTRCDKKIGC